MAKKTQTKASTRNKIKITSANAKLTQIEDLFELFCNGASHFDLILGVTV